MSAKRKTQKDSLESGSGLDDAIAELEKPSTSNSDSLIPGETDRKERRFARFLFPAALLVMLSLVALIGILLGPVRRGEIWIMFQQIVEPQTPNFELLDSRDGVALLTRTERDYSEVIVQLAGQSGWRYVSDDDFTAKFPTLSPSGEQVAYLSEANGVHIEVVLLTSDTRQFVTATIMDTFLSARQMTGLSVCSWSPVHWSPDETHLAFFACLQDPEVSYAAVVDLLSDPPPIVWLEKDGIPEYERSLIWLDSTHLLIGVPTSGNGGTTIETVEVIP